MPPLPWTGQTRRPIEESSSAATPGLAVLPRSIGLLPIAPRCVSHQRKITSYPGNYKQYVRLRDERYERQLKEYESQREYIEKQEEYIRRVHYGQLHKQAASRQKQLDKIERVECPVWIDSPQMHFGQVRRTGLATNDEELESGLRSIAVPVRSRTGAVVAAINLAIPWSPAPMSELADQFGPVLQATARQISSLVI